MSTHRFYDIRTVIDEVHALFDAWADAGTLRPPLDCDGEIVLRLAVHEWIANLVQHAVFVEGTPEICLHVEAQQDLVDVAVEDTSSGFDLLGQLEEQHMLLSGPAPSERGRGLLMLITCTEALNYRPAGEGRQRLSFCLRNPSEAVFAGLFRPDSLAAAEPDVIAVDEFVDGIPGGDGLSALHSPPKPNAR